MGPSEVEAIAKRLFGERWKAALARALGVEFTTLFRQVKEDRISGPVACALKAWDRILTTQNLLPPAAPGEEFRDAANAKKHKKLTSYAKAILEDE
jgi:transposase-like protein